MKKRYTLKEAIEKGNQIVLKHAIDLKKELLKIEKSKTKDIINV